MNTETQATNLREGLAHSVDGSQSAFRSVLDAMSHPGKIVSVAGIEEAPYPLNKATAAICLSLVDFETPLWTDSEIASSGAAVNFLRFHCGCPIAADAQHAKTALISVGTELTSFKRFYIGTDERPDLSVTLIVQVKSLSNDDGVVLTGPSINGKRWLNVEGLSPEFWDELRANYLLYPRGLDIILVADTQIVCLPRTTKVGR